MKKEHGLKIFWWGGVALVIVVLHLFLVQLYTPYDTFAEVYDTQDEDTAYAIEIEGEAVYRNPQNAFYFYNNFPVGTYEVAFTYCVTDQSLVQEDVVLSIVDASDYDAEDAQYKTLASVVLSPDETSGTAMFSLDQYSHDIKMMVQGNDDNNVLIEEVAITSTDYVYNDRYVKAIFFDLCALAFAMGLYFIFKKNRDNRKEMHTQGAIFLVLCAIMVLGVYPLVLNPSIVIHGHDYAFHLIRMQSIAADLLSGNFPARITITANRGYGSISNLFYPELFLYLPALLVCLNTNIHTAIVMFVMMISIASVVIAYYSFYKVSGHRVVALTTTALYVLSTYKLCNYYIRCALGEYLFMSFLPLMLYAVYHIFYQDGKRWWLLVIAATCILQSHILGTVLTAILFGVVIVCLLVARLLKKQPVKTILAQLSAAGVSVVLLNAWFLLPFVTGYLSEQFNMFDTEYEFYSNFQLYDITLADVFALVSTYQGGTMVFCLGAPLVIALACSVVILIVRLVRKQLAQPALLVSFGLISVISLVIICADDVTLWLGEHISLFFAFFATMQFGFRCLSIFTAVICFAFLSLAPQLNSKKVQGILCAVLIVLASANVMVVLHSDFLTMYLDDPHYYTLSLYPEEYSRVDTSYWSQWKSYNADPTYSEEVELFAYDKDGYDVVLSYENTSADEGYIELPLYFYSGYQALNAQGQAYNLVIGTNALLRVIVPANSAGEVYVTYTQRTLYRLGDCITLFAAVAFCLLVLPTKYQITPAKAKVWYLRCFKVVFKK